MEFAFLGAIQEVINNIWRKWLKPFFTLLDNLSDC